VGQGVWRKAVGGKIMALNKQKGNMYDFVTHTWNTVKGKCPHSCWYCYMQRYGEQKPMRFDRSELNTNLGSGNYIFVGSSCDMWADNVDGAWICATMGHVLKHPDNTYLFQSKNPRRIFNHRDWLPHKEHIVIGTTIETNRWLNEMENSPLPRERASAIYDFSGLGYKTMVTIEPIMDFDFDEMVSLMQQIGPDWINIGANSRYISIPLPEPEPCKVNDLITALRGFTEVKLKPNLKRVIGKTWDQYPKESK
jgi:hypothetical protein